MKIGSLFDGSGGFPLAAALCGIEPVWASEVEPYPIAVTRSRFPNMKHLGDVSKINGAEIEPVDILSFGSPCQDLSVAGLRQGLRHEGKGDEETTRSGLFLEAIRIIKEMREATHGIYPTFAIFENVTGAFSSSKGEDFRTVLNEFVHIVEPRAEVPPPPNGKWAYADILMGDGFSIAYRVLDAAKWGVPQRRRRIYLVADLRGQRAGKILFKRPGLQGHNAPRREARERTAAETQNDVGTADTESVRGEGISGDIAGTLDASYYKGCGMREGKEREVVAMPELYENHSQDSRYTGPHEVAPTTNAKYGTGGNNQPLIVYGISAHDSNAMKSPNPHSGIYEADTARTIDANGGNPACNQGGMVIVAPEKTRAFIQNQREEVRELGEATASLSASAGMHQQTFVAYAIDQQGGKSSGSYSEEVAPTLMSDSHGTPHAVAHPVKPKDVIVNLNKDDFQSKQILAPDGISPPIYAGEKRGGGREAYVCLPKDVIPINTMVATRGGADDGRTTFGVGEPGEPQFTLQEAHSHAVAYGIDRAAFNQGENAKYVPRIEEEMSATIVARGPNAVAMSVDVGWLNSFEEQSPSLLARQYKDPPLVSYWDGGQTAGTLTANNANGAQRMPDKEHFNCVIEEDNMEQKYIVRRLTPLECCRLQGFPDGWSETDEKTDFTDEEFRFWHEVRNTHAAINGKKRKAYTKKQMLTWYNKLHTDSAEYKMWGNGLALPCALYVMQGIAEELAETPEEK